MNMVVYLLSACKSCGKMMDNILATVLFFFLLLLLRELGRGLMDVANFVFIGLIWVNRRRNEVIYCFWCIL